MKLRLRSLAPHVHLAIALLFSLIDQIFSLSFLPTLLGDLKQQAYGILG